MKPSLTYKLFLVLFSVFILMSFSACQPFNGNGGEVRLLKAAFFGNTKEVSKLIKQGIDINYQDHLGNTALMLAATSGNSSIVQLLIDHHVNIHLKNNNGYTAFLAAAASGQWHSTHILLTNGADFNAVTNKGYHAYELAKFNSQSNTARELRNYAKKHAYKIHGQCHD